MRIWSVHPKYLDVKGLVALWRETLLAKHVLEGKTKGYKNHPQLNRFKKCKDPLAAINLYLSSVYKEAENRGYNFDSNKFNKVSKPIKLNVTKGQLDYEFNHLLIKLNKREPTLYKQLKAGISREPHPIFNVIEGGVETWESIGDKS